MKPFKKFAIFWINNWLLCSAAVFALGIILLANAGFIFQDLSYKAEIFVYPLLFIVPVVVILTLMCVIAKFIKIGGYGRLINDFACKYTSMQVLALISWAEAGIYYVIAAFSLL